MKAGVLLSGSGVMDGSEIHEAVLTLLHLDKNNLDIICMAPNQNQTRVVNHSSNEITKTDTRNMLAESARIARGEIKDLSAIDSEEIDMLILPGGFGAAVNLCSFADEGPSCSVNPEVEKLVNEMIDKNKPIGALCIAPALIARIFGKREIKVQLTIGNDPDTANAINKMGAEHIDCPVSRAIIDRKNRVVTAPAYMLAKNITDVELSVKAMIEGILEILKK